MNQLTGRCMFIWKLLPVVAAEIDLATFTKKVRKAKLSGIWIKVGDGRAEHTNVNAANVGLFNEVVKRMHDAGVSVWGWHVPICPTEAIARQEAALACRLVERLRLDGLLCDAEAGDAYFKGGPAEATEYARATREGLDSLGAGFAVCSHDIPANFPRFPFTEFARHASQNAPQVYYGSSPSVENRLERAIAANASVEIPMVPVGAAWVGDAGGCESPSASAERARAFIRLVHEHGFPGYSFWHWMGAPAKFWEVLFTTPA
ncbi:hypothetical protein BWI17_18300 [Betaproteobacteria bacterium GR16-43]|nr:hypothetical protein BWI17_18300 [Betaproteobacteria bacterium GR16-43]